MDIKRLDEDLRAILDMRKELSTLDYNNEKYDEIEESLHDKEDKFLNDYGGFLEDALYEVHDEYCPDSEVLLPIAYLPKTVKKNGNSEYHVDFREGVYVDADDYPGKETKLVLLPNPTRILLQIDAENSEVVWQVE